MVSYMITMDKFTLGSYLRRLREKQRLSQRDIESIHGFRQANLSKLEDDITKSPGIDTLLKLAEIYSVPIMDLILAYQGMDPDAMEPVDYKSQMRKLKGDMLRLFEKWEKEEGQ